MWFLSDSLIDVATQQSGAGRGKRDTRLKQDKYSPGSNNNPPKQKHAGSLQRALKALGSDQQVRRA